MFNDVSLYYTAKWCSIMISSQGGRKKEMGNIARYDGILHLMTWERNSCKGNTCFSYKLEVDGHKTVDAHTFNRNLLPRYHQHNIQHHHIGNRQCNLHHLNHLHHHHHHHHSSRHIGLDFRERIGICFRLYRIL